MYNLFQQNNGYLTEYTWLELGLPLLMSRKLKTKGKKKMENYKEITFGF
jgi:hypothetical protein